jgi:hypothetical protein
MAAKKKAKARPKERPRAKAKRAAKRPCGGIETGPRGGKYRVCAGGKRIYVRSTTTTPKKQKQGQKRKKMRAVSPDRPIVAPPDERSPDRTQTPPHIPLPAVVPEDILPVPMSISPLPPPPPPPQPQPAKKASPLKAVYRNTYMVQPNMRQYFPEQYGDYDRIRELGRGAYGVVYLAEHRRTRTKVALKVINKIEDMEAFNLIALRLANGSDTPYKMRQRHIVPIFATGMLPDGKKIFVVSELMEGTLFQLGKNLRARTLLMGMRDILLAMRYVHSIGMVHRDLHHNNVLYKKDEFFLGDFGLACMRKPVRNMVMAECRMLSPERWHVETSLDGIYTVGSFSYPVIGKALPQLFPLFVALQDKYVRKGPYVAGGDTDYVPAPGSEKLPPYVDAALELVEKAIGSIPAYA